MLHQCINTVNTRCDHNAMVVAMIAETVAAIVVLIGCCSVTYCNNRHHEY